VNAGIPELAEKVRNITEGRDATEEATTAFHPTNW